MFEWVFIFLMKTFGCLHLFIMPVRLIFSDEGVVPVFNHVLSSFILKQIPYFWPFLSIMDDKLHYLPILILSPVPLYLAFVEMVLPSLPAILRWDELLLAGHFENLHWNLCPPALFAFSLLRHSYYTAAFKRLSSFSVHTILSGALNRFKNWNYRKTVDLPKNMRETAWKFIFSL